MAGHGFIIHRWRKIGTAQTDHSIFFKFDLSCGKMHFNHGRRKFLAKEGIGKLRRKPVHGSIGIDTEVLETLPAAILNGIVSYALGEVTTMFGFSFNPWYGLVVAVIVAGATFAALFAIIRRLNAATASAVAAGAPGAQA